MYLQVLQHNDTILFYSCYDMNIIKVIYSRSINNLCCDGYQNCLYMLLRITNGNMYYRRPDF